MSTLDEAPLLPPPPATVRTQGLRHAARIIRLASGGVRSLTVRETAAQEIEERQIDWAYSLPVVSLDVIWNSTFVLLACVVLFVTRTESTRLPIRVWVVGYGVQCVVHVVCVCFEFVRRRRVRVEANDCFYDSSTLIRHLESANTMFSFLWWLLGFYWISVGGHALQQDSTTLYWLCIIFLVLDLFFVIFCVALASVVAVAVCCCLPCIIAILYVLAHQGGASSEDIDSLSKYTFYRSCHSETIDEDTAESCGGIMEECGTDCPIERILTAEDAECCICLSAYDNGIELRELPCSHHFHCSCVDKWLHINSTCPLCKYDISTRYSRDDEV